MERAKQKLFNRKAFYILPFCAVLLTFFLYFTLDYDTQNSKEEYNVKSVYQVYNPSEIFTGERIVHLDLKGAPPKISYYHRLFPLLSKLGATGLLIEYEDMFPYTGSLLKHITAHNSYSYADIQTINLLAEANNLTVIPLVQTFGHLEFLLKLKQFSFLREVPKFPQVICPTHNMTLNILYRMIRQVIKAHPKSTVIHIGADEVYNIGECDRCKQIMFEEKISKRQLFLAHIKKVAIKIKMHHPNMNILMWDDEFRHIFVDDLKNSAMSLLVEPVVWKYTANVLSDISYDLFNMYSEVFKTVWFASAFKGATGSNQYLTPISHHTSNHQSWMQIYNEYKNKMSIRGILITGWQRYDHFAVLCELLPVGIPSLAFSLNLLFGYSSTESYTFPVDIINILECKNSYALLDFNNGLPNCKYPGGQILDAIIAFHQVKEKYNHLLEDSQVQGWMTSYNNNHNFSSPAHVNRVLTILTDLLGQLTSIEMLLIESLAEVFDNYTVSEWHETFVTPIYEEMKKLLDTANNLLSANDWPRRPL